MSDRQPIARSLKQTLISAPATVAYLLILVGTTAVLTSSSVQSDNHLLLAVSTNLHQLAHVPVRVLVASAFWTGGWRDLVQWIVLFAVIVAPVERRLGWRPTTQAFAAGHIGATLIVAAGLWSGVRLGAVNPADTYARDVGASYGFFAIAAFAAYLLAPRFRLPYLVVMIGYLVVKAALFHTFSDFGHLAAVAIGFACYPLARSHEWRARVSLSPRTRRLEPADVT